MITTTTTFYCDFCGKSCNETALIKKTNSSNYSDFAINIKTKAERKGFATDISKNYKNVCHKCGQKLYDCFKKLDPSFEDFCSKNNEGHS